MNQHRIGSFSYDLDLLKKYVAIMARSCKATSGVSITDISNVGTSLFGNVLPGNFLLFTSHKYYMQGIRILFPAIGFTKNYFVKYILMAYHNKYCLFKMVALVLYFRKLSQFLNI